MNGAPFTWPAAALARFSHCLIMRPGRPESDHSFPPRRTDAETAANLRATIDDIVAVEDKLVVRWSIRGTFIGEPANGFPAKKGGRFAMGSISIYRLRMGKSRKTGVYN